MKEKNIFQMDYYKTYYFADICSSIMENEFGYIKLLDEFWGDYQMNYFIQPFQKYSNLHMYIEFIIDSLFNEPYEDFTIEELINKKFWVHNALDYHNIKYISFKEWYKNNNLNLIYDEDLMYEYLNSIEHSLDYMKLKEPMIEETFFILFFNRKFLRHFNLNIAGMFEVSDIDDTYIETLINQKNNTLKRKYIPKWAEKAVFYRDRGICTYCKTDLTGIINISNKYNIDHIIPLNKYGLNDISNLQLLCDSCNKSKGSRHTRISTDYERWYD